MWREREEETLFAKFSTYSFEMLGECFEYAFCTARSFTFQCDRTRKILKFYMEFSQIVFGFLLKSNSLSFYGHLLCVFFFQF